ncbi:MAG: beta-propeller fold lactonase family protein, partial [Erysipelotrichaceae bacterium]|nr:beta-propeller fold lactonase family protein [Erysipelotrichaceae bacterium]
MKKYIYAGTYTSGLSKGIYRFTFEEGRLSDPALFCEIENPKYLCRQEDKIVAVNDFTEGAGLSLIDEKGQIIDSLIYEKATSCYVTSEEG